jgi:hypothetical protein
MELGLGHRLEQVMRRGIDPLERDRRPLGRLRTLHDPMLRCRAMTGIGRRVALGIMWLAIVAVISVGAAGLVTAMAHQPGTASRAELTLSGDDAAKPKLDTIQDGVVDLAGDVKQLGELGRAALAALATTDPNILDTTVAQGEQLAQGIEQRAAQLKEELKLVPGAGPQEPLLWSPATSHRRDLQLDALQATDGLQALWSRLAVSSAAASRVSALLTQHDQVVGDAFTQGRAAKYTEALAGLDRADAIIAQARQFADALRNTVDVSTLTQWLDRNAEYDTALRQLYVATVAGDGKVTQAMRDANVAERKAHSLLPSNTSGIVIILAEIGRGGLNQAVIGIEEARGELQASVDELVAGPSPSDEPGDAESPAPS